MTKKTRIASFSIHQSAKFIAVMVALIVGVISIPIGIYMLVVLREPEGVFYLIAPFLAMVVKYLFSALYFYFYNLIARLVGGIEVLLEERE